jgi:thiamine kinase-like enzyme
LLHGDLKFDNIGLEGDGRMWLIDWALTLVAPAAVEVGWFLAINSRRMTLSLEAVLDAYAAAAPHTARDARDGLAAICGLLLRGWRKALDAETGEPAELQWWCDRALAAEHLLR